MLLFGCRPEDGVFIDTQMVKEIAQILQNRFDPVNFSIKIPVVFDQLKGEDAKFEMVVSNDI